MLKNLIHLLNCFVMTCACVVHAAGGMDNIVLGTLNKYASGFVGCLSNVTLAADYAIDLIADADDGRNVRQCSDLRSRRHFTT